MTPEALEPTDDDPHEGYKRVWACNVDATELLDGQGAPVFPYPEGTVIVKESQKPGQNYVWLVATATKRDGRWTWDEYTRNFGNEPLARILADETTCTGCHDDARGTDFIFTVYPGP